MPADLNRYFRGTVGFAPGGFDMFHVGHLNLIRRAREACDYLVVGVASDELLLARKGRLPVVPLAERLEIVRAIRYVDEAVVDTSTEKGVAWAKVGFDVLFKGSDWQGTRKGDHLEQAMAELGVEVTYLPYTAETSSTLLRSALGSLVND